MQAELGSGGLDARGAHGLAVFASSAADLFEVLKLSEPVDHDPVIADAPFIEPLSAIGRARALVRAARQPPRWRGCSAVRARRSRRSSSSRTTLRRRHDQGGWSQANYQRSIDKDVDDHLRRAAKVAFAHLQDDLPVGILVGAPQRAGRRASRPTCTPTCAIASPGGWTSTSSTRAPTTCAARPRRASSRPRAHARTRRWRGWPRPSPAARGRAASGLPEVLAAVHEQRVETCWSRPASRRPGCAAPRAAGSATEEAAACPADGSATEHLDDLVEAAVERALTQAADVRVLRDRAELASHGRIAAVLRF